MVPRCLTGSAGLGRLVRKRNNARGFFDGGDDQRHSVVGGASGRVCGRVGDDSAYSIHSAVRCCETEAVSKRGATWLT